MDNVYGNGPLLQPPQMPRQQQQQQQQQYAADSGVQILSSANAKITSFKVCLADSGGNVKLLSIWFIEIISHSLPHQVPIHKWLQPWRKKSTIFLE